MKFRNFDKYEVFEDGRIWSYKTNRFLKHQTKKNGYQQVKLYDNEGNMKMYLLHRVVWEAVSGEPIPECMQINHRNEIKTDNRFENLYLVTPKENCNFGTRNERLSKSKINGNNSKAVGAFKDGKLVMTFPSTNEAGRQGFHQAAVAKCCICAKSYKTHKGFTWKYL